MTKPKCIAVVLVDRANYGRMKPVLSAIDKSSSLKLETICAGTMVLQRFGRAVDIVREDGFPVCEEVYFEVEGSIPATMAKSLAFAVLEFTGTFQRIKPDIVLIIGDRYEALGAAIAAAYSNLCIAHIQGGEVSGSIDESARHCITKLAHYHFPSTERAREFIIKMGEPEDRVVNTGCPSGDIILKADRALPQGIFAGKGVGAITDRMKPYLLVIYHPVTTSFDTERENVIQLLEALGELRHPTVWLWPNIDAGSDLISNAIRAHRELKDSSWLQVIKNFNPEDFQKVLANASCAIGNSSSFIRDSSFHGTPIVLVGDRQIGREYAENLRAVPARKAEIMSAVVTQLTHGRYQPSVLYGRGDAAQRIVSELEKAVPFVQKHLDYIYR